MSELPFLPLHVDALLSDTSHMSAEEFGVYCRLLFTAWRHRAILPNRPAELARIAGVTRKDWNRLAPVVLRPMTMTTDHISQKRLTDTWMRVQEMRKQRAVSGRNGAITRWKSKKPP